MLYYVLIGVGLVLFLTIILVVREIWHQRAINHALLQGRFEQVLADYQTRSQEPDTLGAITQLHYARIALLASQPQKARSAVYQALENLLPAKLNSQAFSLLARASLLKGELKQAAKEGMRALKCCEQLRIKKFVLEALLVLSRVQLELGAFAKAEQCLNKILAIEASNCWAAGLQGYLAMVRGDLEQARRLLQKHLLRLAQIRPGIFRFSSPQLLLAQGKALEDLAWVHLYQAATAPNQETQQDCLKQAQEIAQRALTIWPANRATQIIPQAQLALVLVQNGQAHEHQQAATYIEQAQDSLANYPDNKWLHARFYLLHGLYCTHCDQASEAARSFDQATQQGEFPLIKLAGIYYQAELARTTGERAKACQLYQQVMAARLDCYHARRAQQQLNEVHEDA